MTSSDSARGTIRYSAADSAVIQSFGTVMLKKPNPVFMLQVNMPFSVETNEGVMTGQPGGYVAYDPISGHVWPVSKEYVGQHYEPLDGQG